MKKYFLYLILFIALGLSACGEKINNRIESSGPIPDQEILDFTVTETRSGKLHWVLEANTAQIIEADSKATLEAPKIKFYKKGEYVSTLTSEKGLIDMRTYDVLGEGKCLLETAKGDVLDTSNLRYISKTEKIVTNEKVKLIRENSIIRGIGMEATPDLETIIIKNQTTEVK